MNRVGLNILVAALVFFGGCGSKELSRGRAKEMLERAGFSQAQKQWVPLQRPTVDALIQSGYLRWRAIPPMTGLELTPEGKKYFEQSGGVIGIAGTMLESFKVMPLVPVRILIKEVTGITDGRDGTKVVEYTWNYDDSVLPPEARKFFVGGAQGEAVFKMYDDGWRILSY